MNCKLRSKIKFHLYKVTEHWIWRRFQLFWPIIFSSGISSAFLFRFGSIDVGCGSQVNQFSSEHGSLEFSLNIVVLQVITVNQPFFRVGSKFVQRTIVGLWAGTLDLVQKFQIVNGDLGNVPSMHRVFLGDQKMLGVEAVEVRKLLSEFHPPDHWIQLVLMIVRNPLAENFKSDEKFSYFRSIIPFQELSVVGQD